MKKKILTLLLASVIITIAAGTVFASQGNNAFEQEAQDYYMGFTNVFVRSYQFPLGIECCIITVTNSNINMLNEADDMLDETDKLTTKYYFYCFHAFLNAWYELMEKPFDKAYINCCNNNFNYYFVPFICGSGSITLVQNVRRNLVFVRYSFDAIFHVYRRISRCAGYTVHVYLFCSRCDRYFFQSTISRPSCGAEIIGSVRP